MKLTFLFLLVGLISVSASTYSQITRLDINVKNNSVVELFKEIENRSEFYFFYQKEEISELNDISIDLKDARVTDILDQVLDGTDFSYKIVDRYIIIKKAEKTIDNKNVKPQQKQVNGKVVGKDGAPIPGVSIVVKGTTTGTVTDFNGNFQLDIPASAEFLQFSFIGMITQEVAVAGQTQFTVIMENETISLAEVVAVGYGSVKKSDLTAAISSVQGEKIAGRPVLSPVQAIQGQAAGVNITGSGEPGRAGAIRIRGVGSINNSSSPLIIVDGVIGDMNTVSPSDIQSMEILKDAAYAAAYGARAANGVIIITTKRGAAGKISMNVNSFYGVQEFSNLPVALNAQQYAMILDEANRNAGTTPPQSALDILANPNVEETDWVGAVARPGIIQKHELSASGGNETARFFFSLGYGSQEGTIIETNHEKYNLRLNSDFIFGKLKIGESLGIAYNRTNPLDGYLKQNQTLREAVWMPPTIKIYDENLLGGFSGADRDYHGVAPQNPVSTMHLTIVENDRLNGSANLFAEYEFIEGLTYKMNLGLDGTWNYNTRQALPYDIIGWNYYSNSLLNNTSQAFSLVWENILSYTRSFGDHNISAVGAYTQERFSSRRFSAFVEGDMLNNEIPIFNQFSGELSYNVNGLKNAFNIESFLGKFNYNYAGKYYLTGVIRRDASSRFGPGKKVGIFPSLSGAWRISEESFFDGLKNTLNNLKLRASFGTVGRLPDDNFAWQATAIGTDVVVFGGNYYGTMDKSSFANLDLQWETEKQINVGFDAGLANTNLTFSFDYYNRVTNDMLLNRPLPPSSGWVSTNVNVGSLKNSGFEITANYSGEIGKLTYDVSANVSHFKNEVLDIGGPDEYVLGEEVLRNLKIGSVTRSVEGRPYSSFYGFIAEGIYQSQDEINPTFAPNASAGDIKYADLDGDGLLTGADKDFIGNPFPSYTYGVNIDLGYSNFDFSMQWYGVQDIDIFNNNLYDTRSAVDNRNQEAGILDRWTPENPGNKWPRVVVNDPNGNWSRPSTIFIEDGSYLKLKYLTLGYTIPGSVLQKTKIGNVRLYVQAQNLLTITNYSGLDPEVGEGFFGRGIDAGNAYPVPRSYVAGVQIQF
ncbi:MAG: TonB-dependent receptor [Draconibacterium sp.]|nr:TonB-dependent receptor [Draconibacterium sp.]